MKVKDIFESPLGSFGTYDSDKVSTLNRPARGDYTYDKLDKSKIKEILSKRLAHVSYNLNFYLYKDTEYRLHKNTLNHKSDAPNNEEAFIEIDPDEIDKFFNNPSLTNDIKHSNNDISVIFLSADTDGTFQNHRSAWTLVHDFIHGITVSNPKQNDLIEQADDLVKETFFKIYQLRKHLDFSRFSKIEYSNSEKKQYQEFLASIGTMKSARENSSQLLPEFTTEVFTQYIFTSKGIVFNKPGLIQDNRYDMVGEKQLDKLMINLKKGLEGIYDEILKHAVGHIYITPV